MRAQDGLNMAESWGVRLLLVAVTIGGVLFAQHATYIDMVEAWGRTTAYNHCFVIPFISLFVAWKERYRLLATRPSVSWTGVGFVALCCSVLFLGTLMTINALQHLAAIGLIVGAFWSLLGSAASRALWFPLIYLFFMVPEGEFLVPYLQDWTAFVVVKLLRWTGMPVFIEGRFLQIPSGAFTVAQACSGLNYLLASLAVGSLFAYYTFVSVWRRLVFMAFSILVPLVANGIRAYGIILIAHYSGYRYAMGVDHFIYGGVFFGVIIFVLFATGRAFSDRAEELSARSSSPSRAMSSGNGINVLLAVAFVFGLTLTPKFLSEKIDARSDRSRLITPDFAEIHGWALESSRESRLHSRFPGAAIHVAAPYETGNGSVLLQVGIFQSDGPESELVSSNNSLFDKKTWRFSGDADVGNLSTEQNRFVVNSGDEQHLVQWWYQVGGDVFVSGLAAKFREGWLKLQGGYICSLIVVIDLPFDSAAPEQATDLLQIAAVETRDQLAGICSAE